MKALVTALLAALFASFVTAGYAADTSKCDKLTGAEKRSAWPTPKSRTAVGGKRRPALPATPSTPSCAAWTPLRRDAAAPPA